MTRTPIQRFQTNGSSVYFELRRSTSDYYFWLGSFHNIFFRRFFSLRLSFLAPPIFSFFHTTPCKVRGDFVRINLNMKVNIDLDFFPITNRFPITLHFSLLFSSSVLFFQPNKYRAWLCASSLSSWKRNEIILTTEYLFVSIHVNLQWKKER